MVAGVETLDAGRAAAPSVRRIVRAQSVVGFTLTAVLLVLWFGFVLAVAFAKAALSVEIVPGVTRALAVGTGVLGASWLLACLYMVWAERWHDAALAALVREEDA